MISRFAFAIWILVALCAPAASAQLTQKSGTVRYINPGEVASPIRSFLSAFGDRIQRPGKERVVLVGKYTDRNGDADVVVVWEVPGRLRFDRSDKPGRAIIYNDSQGWINVGAIAPEEADALESLLDDSPESFFYAMAQGVGRRFLGSGFRLDGGKTPNYKGPWYHVYEVFPATRSPQGISRTRKVFFFDSQTGLLSRVEYLSSGSVHITTELNSWRTHSGQAFPGSVVRKENGVTVLTLNFTSASVAPSASDGVFTGR